MVLVFIGVRVTSRASSVLRCGSDTQQLMMRGAISSLYCFKWFINRVAIPPSKLSPGLDIQKAGADKRWLRFLGFFGKPVAAEQSKADHIKAVMMVMIMDNENIVLKDRDNEL